MGALGPTWFQGETEAPAGTVYHYTSRNALARILQAGAIRPHKALPTDRVALVWFSTNGVWEPASGRPSPLNPRQPMTFDQLSQLHGGLARLLVDGSAAELDFATMRTLISPEFLALTKGYGGAWFRQNQWRWYGTRKAVPREYWLAVEVWKGPRWVELPYTWEEG
jgi:hypothetical protein